MRYLLLIVLLGLIGCADSDAAYRNMYEGLKKREEIVNPTAQNKPAEPSMSYDKYDAERKKLLDKDTQK
jgi:hypothetical protein